MAGGGTDRVWLCHCSMTSGCVKRVPSRDRKGFECGANRAGVRRVLGCGSEEMRAAACCALFLRRSAPALPSPDRVIEGASSQAPGSNVRLRTRAPASWHGSVQSVDAMVHRIGSIRVLAGPPQSPDPVPLPSWMMAPDFVREHERLGSGGGWRGAAGGGVVVGRKHEERGRGSALVWGSPGRRRKCCLVVCGLRVAVVCFQFSGAESRARSSWPGSFFRLRKELLIVKRRWVEDSQGEEVSVLATGEAREVSTIVEKWPAWLRGLVILVLGWLLRELEGGE
jgi:hypothetical protein